MEFTIAVLPHYIAILFLHLYAVRQWMERTGADEVKREGHALGVHGRGLRVRGRRAVDLRIFVYDRDPFLQRSQHIRVPVRHHVEATDGYLRYPADDRGQHLRHRRSHYPRRADRHSRRRLHGAVLFPDLHEIPAADDRADGGYSLGGIRVFRHPHTGAICAQYLRRHGLQYCSRVHSASDDDPAPQSSN